MIFVDTGMFYARLAEDDENHTAADAFFLAQISSDLVTTREVIYETHALMLNRLTRVRPDANMEPEARRFLRLIDDGLAAILPTTDADHEAARQLVDVHRDKGYSLCDALSFVVMERLGITVAASFDRHFRQYGRFTIVP